MKQAKTIWQLVRFTNFDRAACSGISDHGVSPSQTGKEHHEQISGRGFAPLICISMWLSSQAMVSVLTGSAAMILVGLFLASGRLIHERFVLQPASAEDESFHPLRRLRGCPGWRMRDEEYL